MGVDLADVFTNVKLKSALKIITKRSAIIGELKNYFGLLNKLKTAVILTNKHFL